MLVRATELPRYPGCESSQFATVGRFLLWLKSSSSSGTRQPPIRHVRCDSARCSIRIAQEERARPIYQRALKAQGRARARAAPKSKSKSFSLLLWFKFSFGYGAWVVGASLVLFPPNRGLGQSPKLNPSLRVSSKMLLSLDHDKAQFLSRDPSGLQPPDIDDESPADSDHGFFL